MHFNVNKVIICPLLQESIVVMSDNAIICCTQQS